MKIKNRKVFLTSDLHLGQESFYKFNEKKQNIVRPEFKNAIEADEEIIRRHNEVVPELGSIVYFLGDLAWNSTALDKLHRFNGEWKILVGGNHDVKFPLMRLQTFFDKICGAVYIKEKKIVLTHIPIHPEELRGYENYHGHVHLKPISDSRYHSVCLETNNYYPTKIQ